MSKIALNSTSGDSGTVTFTSPVTNSSRTLTIPDKTGTLSVTTDFTDGLTAPSFASMNGGQLAGFRNKIINGGFDVWQRGTSGFSLNSYCADRWYIDAGTSVSRSTDVPAGFTYSLKHTGVATNAVHRTGIELPGTGVQGEYYDGATFTFSCLCKTSVAGKTLTLYSAFTTAVGVAGSRTVSNIAIGTTSTSWTKHTYTFTIPTGASIATAKCLEVAPYVNAPNCDVYITGVQLESGPVATPFEIRPYSVELALCQRYGFRLNDPSVAYATIAFGYGSTTTACTIFVSVPVGLRVKPSSVVFTASGFELVDPAASTTQTVTAMSIPSYVNGILTLYCSVASGITVGKTYNLRQLNNTAAIIDLFTEL